MKSQDRSRQLQVLVELAGAVSRARDSADIYRTAVDGLIRALGRNVRKPTNKFTEKQIG